MLLDYVDTAAYEKMGVLRYYVDILDPSNKPIEKQEPKLLSFFVNNEPVPLEKVLSVELRTFAEVGEEFAVGVLFTNYRGYVTRSAGEASLFGLAKNGIRAFITSLGKQKIRLGVELYNEGGREPVVEFTTNLKNAEQAIDSLPEPVFLEETAEAGDVKTKAPDFYRHLDDTVKKMAGLDDLPRRRILIVVSDGLGEYTGARKVLIDRKLEGVIESAVDAGIKVYAFGAFLQDDQFLPYLSRLAERTHGIYQRVDEPEAIEGAIRDLAPQLLKQYVVDVKVPGLPSEDKVTLRMDAETPNKEKVSAAYPKQVKIPPTPTDWKKILTWVGIGVGSLVGLIFFIWMIRKIAQWRSNRPAEQEESGPVYVHSGPDKGRLRVKTGPLAGEIFYLTEEITTIGSLDGNGIIIRDEGVSKRHAGIKIEEMRYELADFNSTNGTWVNGRKINKQFLRDGDEVRIGNTEMTFSLK